MIKLIIFDMDGVLVDACEWHRVSLNQALKDISNYEISIEDHYKDFNGIPTKIKLQILLSRGIIKLEDMHHIERLKQEYTIKIIKNFAHPRQEKIELMKYLKNKGCKIACYTNSIRKTAELMLNNSDLLKYLDLLITNEDIIKSKPDPEGYLFAINHFNVSKDETIIIEDSPIGIEAAKKSGAFVLEVKNQDYVNINLIKDYIK